MKKPNENDNNEEYEEEEELDNENNNEEQEDENEEEEEVVEEDDEEIEVLEDEVPIDLDFNDTSENKNQENNEGNLQFTPKKQKVKFDDNQYDHIKDPNIRRLMNIDIEEENKEEILNLLLTNEALTGSKSEKKLPVKTIKPNRYKNAQSHYNLETLMNDPMYKTTNAFHITRQKDNPEFTVDFNTAVKKIYSKMAKDKNPSTEELLKILVSDPHHLSEEVAKLDIVKREYIDEKVKTVLNKKKQNIENIKTMLDQDYAEKHPFTPTLVKYEQSPPRRNLDQFLSDQQNHLKRLQEKIKMIQDDDKAKEDTIVKQMHPKVDLNSEKIFKRVISTDEPTHLRLYNKRYQNTKKELLKSKQDKEKTEEEAISKGKKKQIKINWPKKASSVDKVDKIPEEVKEHEENVNRFTSNKMLLASIIRRFNSAIDNLTMNMGEKVNEVNQIVEEVEIPGEVEAKLTENETNCNRKPSNRLTQQQLKEVLLSLNFLTYKGEDHNGIGQSILQQDESKLFSQLYKNLKDTTGLVNVDILFVVVLAVLNLYAYYLYVSFKKSIPQEGSKPKLSEEEKKKRIQNILNEISSDIEKKINNEKTNTHSKYVHLDTDDVFYVSFQQAKVIKKDFNMFYINYMNSEDRLTKFEAKSKVNHIRQVTFCPQLNSQSIKMYANFRNKVLSVEDSLENAPSKSDERIDYINKLILKKKRKEVELKKAQEKVKETELMECTFKPKINEDPSSVTRKNEPDRLGSLYQKGKQHQRERRDRERDEFDIERYGKDCTFAPNLSEKNEIIDDGRIKNDIYHERSYELLYTRLKNGRLDRALREAVHERSDFDLTLKEYSKLFAFNFY